MNDCPNSGVLQQFLDETLPGSEFSAIDAHLNQCLTCRAELDRLTAGAAFPWVDSSSVSKSSNDSACARVRPLLAGAIPGYDVGEEIGRGGHGIVYKAMQRGLNRAVALKIIKKGAFASPDEVSRFLREAESAARVQHPQIVRIYAVGNHDDLPFFAMELLEGGSLGEHCSGTPFPARAAAELMLGLVRAVDHAHRHNVIHRDLKPSNILFDRPPVRDAATGRMHFDAHDGLPKVADFGLAKQSDTDRLETPTVSILGTPSYMAPELALGDARVAGPAADVYSLGAILYELLTGRPPFRGDSPFETLLQVRNDDPVAPRQLQPRLPQDLETICLKCLRKQPKDRYAMAAALAEDLRLFLAGEPIAARPPGPVERVVKWARRNRRRTALIVLSAGILGTVTFVSGLLAHQVREARFDAQTEEFVESLQTTDINQFLVRLAKLGPIRARAEPALRRIVSESDAGSAVRWRAALALLPGDRQQADCLLDRLDSTTLDELLVTREALQEAGCNPTLRLA
ncbi:MAG: serine/threonine protein kinase [Planctomycetaceae bacterium]|nr:serine/threonine protein kinase [Planctomycetaceae bacterium]